LFVDIRKRLGGSEFDEFNKLVISKFEAFNEGQLVESMIESYYAFYDYYPEYFLGDKIYLNRANRKYLNKKHVKIVGKFEQAKRGYKLNNIKARLASTSESWVNTILFVLNLKSIENLSKFYLCKQDELKIKSADPIYIYLFSNDEKINKKII